MGTPNYAYRLRKKRDKVLRDLEPKKILNLLYQEEVFELEDMEEVKEGGARNKQANILLDKILCLGDEDIATFVNALERTQRHLYKLLQNPVPGEELAEGGLCSIFEYFTKIFTLQKVETLTKCLSGLMYDLVTLSSKVCLCRIAESENVASRGTGMENEDQ